MKTFLWAILLTLLSAPIGFSQSSTPAAAGQCNVTDGAGGWTLQTCGGGSGVQPVLLSVSTYGAVANATGATGVGTDNTTAIQACINAVEAESPALTPAQGCLLGPGLYRTISRLLINKSGVQLWGSAPGAWSFNTSNQLIGKAPISAIVIDSPSADGVDVSGGSIGTPVSFNTLKNFTVIRAQADNGTGSGCLNVATPAGAAGVSVQYAGGWMIDGVWSEESACGFYFQNAGAYGTGYMENSGVLWAANGFNPGTPVYGVLLNGANSAESFRLRHSFVQTLYPGYSGVQSIGFAALGTQLNDIMLDNFETAFVTYGEFLLYTGGGGTYSCSDIHLLDTINDSFFQNGVVVDGLTSACGAQVEINGGWETTGQAGASSNSAGVLIMNSTGVTVSNTGFGQNGSQEFGVLATGSSHISVNGNRFINQLNSSVSLRTVSDATVVGNVIEGTSGNASIGVQGVSLTHSSITANTVGGFMSSGVNLDVNSLHNSIVGTNAIDAANFTFTTPVIDASTGGTNTQTQ